MNARAWLIAMLLIAACGKEQPLAQTSAAPAPAQAAAKVAFAPGEDPEPPDAQARAEAVVNADFNRNKTTKLTMRMTTIVGRTSSLEGFATGLAAREDKIEDRLARLAARQTETEVVIQLPGAILFDFDSSAIRPDAERTLNDVAEVIKAYANRPVRIEGHTDSIASDDYNNSLSKRRAQSVMDWLNVRGGVERTRLTSVGFGETKPVADNESAAGRQKNRRVEVVIAKK
ncbi:MAG TPA: OmpA family protein [Thermoanaerobaculia bacterium]|nr:OmpA family protein [Thermoanaerobaculia bacterium]